MKTYLYIAEVQLPDGQQLVPVLSGIPLSPMEIKAKLSSWLVNSTSWDFLGWWEIDASNSNQNLCHECGVNEWNINLHPVMKSITS